MINLIIHGTSGKFGKTILNCIKDNTNIAYIGFIDRNTDYLVFFHNIFTYSNVVIVDITSESGCKFLLENLIKNKIYYPLIIGTTGNLPIDLINEYSNNVPVAQISNFSDGISSILEILPKINLPNSDIKILETHHKQKKDAPSGTAKTLADKINLDHSKIFFAREGEIYGIHEVIYETPSETITIKHEVKNSNIFAIGCLNWIEKILKLSINWFRSITSLYIR
jgi:4-hydroxy-tetrahydrodipicolinate reductase